MSYAVVITCDVCRVRGLEAAFERSDETFNDILAALVGDGWQVFDGIERARSTSRVNLEKLELMCPECAARDPHARAKLLELRKGVEDAARAIGREEPDPFRAAWHSLAELVVLHGAGVAVPRSHLHRLEGTGQVVPITTERLAARVVEEWSPPLTVTARHDGFVFEWKKDHEIS